MADEKTAKGSAPLEDKTAEGDNPANLKNSILKRAERVISNWDKTYLDEIFIIIGLLWFLTTKAGKSAVQSGLGLIKQGAATGGTLFEGAIRFLSRPWISRAIRTYLFFLPTFSLVCWILGFKTTAFVAAVAQLLLLSIVPLFLLNPAKKEDQKGIISRILLGFVKVEFYVLALLNFLIVLPTGVMDLKTKANLFGLIVGLLLLSIILQGVWRFGWVVIYLISALPLLVNGILGQERLQNFFSQRYSNQRLVTVEMAYPAPTYDIVGKFTNNKAAVGDTLVVDFSDQLKIPGNFLTRRVCYIYRDGRIVDIRREGIYLLTETSNRKNYREI